MLKTHENQKTYEVFPPNDTNSKWFLGVGEEKTFHCCYPETIQWTGNDSVATTSNPINGAVHQAGLGCSGFLFLPVVGAPSRVNMYVHICPIKVQNALGQLTTRTFLS